MFQLLRRVSSVFLPRPDRPWSDDATSNAPTIGRKRRHSVTQEDDGGSAAPTKRTKHDLTQSSTKSDALSGEGISKAQSEAASPVEGGCEKELTGGAKEIDPQDQDTMSMEEATSISAASIPLPDSRSGSPEPECESGETAPGEPVETEESQNQEDAEVEDDRNSLASSAPENAVEEEAEFVVEAFSNITDAPADKIAPTREITIAVRASLLDTPESVEVKA